MMTEQSPKERFFAAAPKPKVSTVELEGQTVTIREMNVGERIAFEDMAKGKTNNEVALLVVVFSMVDASGNLMFTADDIDRLKTLPTDYFLPAITAAFELNALTERDVKELAKN